MDYRLADMSDLSKLNEMYTNIIEKMVEDNINIWELFDPRNFFEDDINSQRMYVLESADKMDIMGAFVIFDTTKGAKYISWKEDVEALYLSRLGVNPKYQKMGIGSKLLDIVIDIAKGKGVKGVRLFVVDVNVPAERFYSRNGFSKAGGIYDDVVGENIIFIEFGYERYL